MQTDFLNKLQILLYNTKLPRGNWNIVASGKKKACTNINKNSNTIFCLVNEWLFAIVNEYKCGPNPKIEIKEKLIEKQTFITIFWIECVLEKNYYKKKT